MTPDEAKAINAILDALATDQDNTCNEESCLYPVCEAKRAWHAAGRPRVADVCKCGGEIVEVCKRCGERRGR